MATKKAAAPTIGKQIDDIWAAREVKRALEAQVKEADENIKAREEALLAELQALGLESAKGAVASVSVSKSVAGNVTDWNLLWPWIARTKNFHLVQKRISDVAYREQLDLGKKIPGVEPFEKRRLNLRTV